MRRLLIVDDEKGVCDRMTGLLAWEEYGVRSIETAFNGEQALDLLRSMPVDLVLTDIKMPHMDGLTLAARLHAEQPCVKMIMMSAYNDFSYAQAAIKYGVRGYLLKPVVREELEELVRFVAEQWRQEAAEPAAPETDELHFISLLQGSLSGRQEWQRLLRAEGANPYVRVVVCAFDSLPDIGPPPALRHRLRQAASRWPLLRPATELVYGNRLVLLIPHSSPIGKLDLLQPLRGLEDELRSQGAELSIGESVTFGVGNLHQGDGAVAASYHEAIYALSARFFHGTDAILFRQELPSGETGRGTDDGLFKERQRTTVGRLAAAVADRQIAEARRLAQACFDLPDADPPRRAADIRFDCIEIVFAVDRIMQERQAEDRFPRKSEAIETIQQTETLAGLKAWFVRTMEAVAARPESAAASGNRYVQTAQRYVEAHYRDKIMVEDVAEHLHLNTKYFSSLFKRETGESFVDYVNRLRIEKAAELILKSDAKIYEISNDVGFSNFSYFNKLFKKISGVTPLAYRNRRTKDGG